jgi:ribonucleoside-diphosphate reductase alpha chain
LKPEDWDLAGEWFWDNRDFYNGLSVLPFSEHTYKQAPFEDCTKEEFERLFSKLHSIDLSKVVELTDETELSDSVACGGGACEIV